MSGALMIDCRGLVAPLDRLLMRAATTEKSHCHSIDLDATYAVNPRGREEEAKKKTMFPAATQSTGCGPEGPSAMVHGYPALQGRLTGARASIVREAEHPEHGQSLDANNRAYDIGFGSWSRAASALDLHV